MGWRLHLSTQPFFSIHLLDGDPVLVAVWTTPQHVQFFVQHTAAFYASLAIARAAELVPGGVGWPAFVDSLRAPNGAILPVVDAGPASIYSTHDGRLRVYHTRDHKLLLDSDGEQVVLENEHDAPIAAVGLDRDLGTIAALSADGVLHLYQQHVAIGAYRLDGLSDGIARAVLVPEAGDTVFMIAPDAILAVDMAGQVRYRQTNLPLAGPAACSPDGEIIVLGDCEHGMIWVYDRQLNPVRKQAAAALLEAAVSVQLLDQGMDLADVRPDLIDVANDGTLIFSSTGTLCVSAVEDIDSLPRPRALF